MVDRPGQVLAYIIQAIMSYSSVSGHRTYEGCFTNDYLSKKNSRPGRTGYSPRALVYGLYEQLLASCLDHHLDNIMLISCQDTFQHACGIGHLEHWS